MNEVIRPGDRVQLSAKTHSWHTEHMVDCYQAGGEFQKENYEEIAMLLLSKARRAKLKGTVLNYGADDDEFKNKRKFVNVKFEYKDMHVTMYCSQKDLKKL